MKKDRDSFRDIFKTMFSLTEDVATHDEIKECLLDGGKITGTNMCVLICAMVIASVGLNTGSTAVITGAHSLIIFFDKVRELGARLI